MGRPKRNLPPASPPLDERAQAVLDELHRRAAAGHPLNSGANRGDWLYAAAVRFFGSWSAAVDAAGFDPDAVRQAGLSSDETLRRIRRLAEAEGDGLRSRNHSLVASGAMRHFGGWEAALAAAGCKPRERFKWTPVTVIAAIQAEVANGLPVNSVAVARRYGALYLAGRRRFGTWAEALTAAGLDSVRSQLKRGRPRSRSAAAR